MKKFETRQELYSWLPRGGVVAEIGVFKGDNALDIWNINQPSKLHLIDAWRKMPNPDFPVSTTDMYFDYMRQTQNKLMDGIDEGRVLLYQGDSKDIVPFMNIQFDWVYIDSNHLYESVMADLEMVEDKIKSGGFICGHDYTEETELAVKKNYGVVEAVRDFCDVYKWEMVALALDSLPIHPSFCLARRER